MLRQARKLTTIWAFRTSRNNTLPGPCGFETLGRQAEHTSSLYMIYEELMKRKSWGKHDFVGLPCWNLLVT